VKSAIISISDELKTGEIGKGEAYLKP